MSSGWVTARVSRYEGATALTCRAPWPERKAGITILRVLIAEDEPLVRYALRAILESAPDIEVVGEADDGAEAVAMTNAARPDVVLMDIRMRPVDGITATRRLLNTAPDTKVLVLTTMQTEDLVTAALQAGASGYLLKTSLPPQVLGAVRAVAAGDVVLSTVISGLLVQKAAEGESGREQQARNQLSVLSARERDVIQLLAVGMSNTEIALALCMSLASVKTYVSRLLGKLSLDNRTQAAVLARDAGLAVS